MGGKRDDGNVRLAGLQGANGSRGIVSIHFGHAAIHEDEVIGKPAGHLGRLPPIGRQIHAATAFLEQPHADLLIDRIVLGDQDAAALA